LEIITTFFLADKVPSSDLMIMGRLYRNGENWEFQAMGDGYNGGLDVLVNTYA
jgi:stress response protein SCP2